MKFVILLLCLSNFNNTMANESYIAHEWGTFTSLVGSDGVRQNGMYHEDEELPSFVHRFGEESGMMNLKMNPVAMNSDGHPCPPKNKACSFYIGKQLITQKMETPVLYFYSPKEINVNVEVAFPNGIISESYPAPSSNFPIASEGVKLINGFAHYDITVLDPGSKNLALLNVASENIYSHARKVKSNLIKSREELEKFIFYRGIGDFTTDLKITSIEDSLTIKNLGKNISDVFVINFDGTNGDIKALGKIEANKSINFTSDQVVSLGKANISQNEYIKKARTLIKAALISNGLFEDEASALLNTWQQSYLKNKGLRILYILNRDEVERILPMNITPMPKELKRVFVGRIEVLTESNEKALLEGLKDDNFNPTNLGRMAQPILERLKTLAKTKILPSQTVKNIEKSLEKSAE